MTQGLIMRKILLLSLALLTSYATAADQADQSQQIQLLNQRIYLLESALAPTTPKAFVKAYAEAVKQRNGAVQYMLFCPNLQKQYLPIFQAMNWVSGTSSPNVSSYDIKKVAANKVAITFSVSLQNQPAGTMVDQLTIEKVQPSAGSTQHFCITAYTRVPHLNGSN